MKFISSLLHINKIVIIIGINIVTFIIFAYDKLCAKLKIRRVPEYVLLFMSLCFGSFGALVSMYIFNHKIKKKKFLYIVVFFLLIHIFYIWIKFKK